MPTQTVPRRWKPATWLVAAHEAGIEGIERAIVVSLDTSKLLAHTTPLTTVDLDMPGSRGDFAI